MRVTLIVLKTAVLETLGDQLLHAFHDGMPGMRKEAFDVHVGAMPGQNFKKFPEGTVIGEAAPTESHACLQVQFVCRGTLVPYGYAATAQPPAEPRDNGHSAEKRPLDAPAGATGKDTNRRGCFWARLQIKERNPSQ